MTSTDDMSSNPDITVEHDVIIPARDGVRLATDIYRPCQAEPVPVILERTPYGKQEVSRSEVSLSAPVARSRSEVAAYFLGHGYAVAYQDCRGRYDSEGSFSKYLNEGQDGYDAIAWLAAQPWCNGRIGTMGLSYAAHTQVAAACLNPPGLACMFVDSGGFSNAYQGGIRQGGAYELKQLTWAYKQALLSPQAAADPDLRAALEAEDIAAWLTRMPWRPGHSPLRSVPDYERYVIDLWSHGRFDDFWQQLGIYAAGFYDQFADVPMVHMSSWYDCYARTATENYRGLKSRKDGPVKLIMGPWLHGDRSMTVAGDVDFGLEATLDGSLAEDFASLRLRWFDRWLKEGPDTDDDWPAVRIFVMGGGSGRRNAAGRLDHGGRWRAAADWPLPDTAYTSYYLHAGGSLSPEPPTAPGPPLTYRFDPADPVPTIGGTITIEAPIMEGGAFDQREDPRFFGCEPPYRPLAERPDVLVFETAPLASDVEVTGPIAVRLWVSSDCPDTDFTAKLIDHYPPSPEWPDGFAMNITDGILRARYRTAWDRPEMMQPGEVYEITIEPFPTSNLFRAGHRIRLDISSSNFPHFDVNPNTGDPEAMNRDTRVATNRVHADTSRPSHIVLPIVRR